MRHLVSICCLVVLVCFFYVEANAPNICITYSCGCCCSNSALPCCNPGYRARTTLLFDSPEEEAVETLGLGGIIGDGPGNSRPTCRLSCSEVYQQHSSQINSILGLSNSVHISCALPALTSSFSHQWYAYTEENGEPRCFSMYDLGGVDADDRAMYLRQITDACFRAEQFSCPSLGLAMTTTNLQPLAPAYSSYVQSLRPTVIADGVRTVDSHLD